MRADRAAVYFSVSRSTFLQWVDEGKMPQPVRINGVVLWDRLALDVAFEALATVEDRPNSFDAVIDGLKHD
jgi:predicted DNA-binding transcriptional regulator AlpA